MLCLLHDFLFSQTLDWNLEKSEIASEESERNKKKVALLVVDRRTTKIPACLPTFLINKIKMRGCPDDES